MKITVNGEGITKKYC